MQWGTGDADFYVSFNNTGSIAGLPHSQHTLCGTLCSNGKIFLPMLYMFVFLFSSLTIFSLLFLENPCEVILYCII